MSNPSTILKEKFGFSEFRYEQEKIIESVLNRKDTFVLMPTGGGKSLCFQIPALLFEGLTVVVSPLIALMKDQVDALRLNGVEAAFLNSTLDWHEQSQVMANLRSGKIKLLYIAPEKLFINEMQFLNFLKTLDNNPAGSNNHTGVSLFAIDEAHCISHWGHDFRPEYLALSNLKKFFPKVPVIALTATADVQTRVDILEKLFIDEPQTFISSFNRENIHYFIEPKRNSYERLIEFLREREEESGIVYVLSRKSAENLAEDLENEGFSAKPYHAGLDKGIRGKHQDLFIKDQVKIIVATIAFGMGIDKSNVRFVVHMDLPKNIESYYQETGRAGRDGLKSDALLFFSFGDVIKLRRFVEIEDNKEQSAIMMEKLDKMADFCQSRMCRRKFLLNYFGEEFPGNCESCDICLDKYEKFDGTIIAQKALSAVARLDENFGINYVIDFLRGSQSGKIKEWHKTLKTFGIGEDIPKNEWHRYFRELISRDYLVQSDGNYPVLKLTEKSHDILKGKEKVMLIKTVTRKAVPETTMTFEAELFKKLKSIRYELSVKEDVPAYIIFSDATIMEMAAYLPQDFDELEKISGFGEIKLERYGKIFLDAITRYCEVKGLKSKIHLKKPKRQRRRRSVSGSGGSPSPSGRAGEGSDTKAESCYLFKTGKTISEIAASRALKNSTIESHLAYYVLSGDIKVDELVPTEKITHIEKAIKLHGDQALAPVKNELGDGFTYGEIRAVVNHLRRGEDLT
ncbi:MAG: DNA helicase RecQ [Bacteroidota bacterium]